MTETISQQCKPNQLLTLDMLARQAVYVARDCLPQSKGDEWIGGTLIGLSPEQITGPLDEYNAAEIVPAVNRIMAGAQLPYLLKYDPSNPSPNYADRGATFAGITSIVASRYNYTTGEVQHYLQLSYVAPEMAEPIPTPAVPGATDGPGPAAGAE